jgi:hypothetical protein
VWFFSWMACGAAAWEACRASRRAAGGSWSEPDLDWIENENEGHSFCK